MWSLATLNLFYYYYSWLTGQYTQYSTLQILIYYLQKPQTLQEVNILITERLCYTAVVLGWSALARSHQVMAQVEQASLVDSGGDAARSHSALKPVSTGWCFLSLSSLLNCCLWSNRLLSSFAKVADVRVIQAQRGRSSLWLQAESVKSFSNVLLMHKHSWGCSPSVPVESLSP